MATTYGITRQQYQDLLNEYKNMSLKKKVEVIKQGKEIGERFQVKEKSHSQKRKWRKENSDTRFKTFAV